MNAIYQVIREELQTVEIGTYTAYGIGAVGEEGQVLAHIHDISTERTAVEVLAEKLNRLEASVLHLTEIVLDYIA